MTRAIAFVLLSTGCLGVNFDPPNVITAPRILAIGSDPPESSVGQDVVFEALVVDEQGNDLARDPDVELRFMVCLSVASIFSAAGLGASVELEDNCGDGGDDLIRLEQGGDLPPGSARFSGAAVLALVAELQMMMGTGEPIPGVDDPQLLATLAAIIAEVGIPLRMRLEVWRDGEEIMSGFKRFAITTREDVTTNPPAPRFAIDGVWLSARDGDDPHTCVPEEGEMPVLQVDTEDVPFTPDENDSEWFEQYPVVSLEGEVVIHEESAYYSWFSTAGKFTRDITVQPDRDNMWHTPEEPGTYPIFLVVRDGHLGLTWCRADVRVE